MTASQYKPQRPLFSIITVTLNPGKDLDDTVRSVLKQSFCDFELVIKDGGSTDGTESLKWLDTRVKRYVSKDTGIFDAMNQALCIVRGEYVQFLNAGDTLIDRDVLKHAAQAIQGTPDAEILYGDVRKLQSRSGYEIYPRRLSRRFLFMNSVCHQAWFVRRETYLHHGGFDTLRPVGADPLLLLRMVVGSGARHVHIPRVVVCYKGGGASTVPDEIREGIASFDALRRELYPGAEYAAYRCLQACRDALKAVAYDTFGWRIWRALRPGRQPARLSIGGPRE